MPTPSPRHVRDRSPRRMLAVGGAAAVTLVTVAGGLGFGPGAALASAHNVGPDRSSLSAGAAAGSSAGPGADRASAGGGGGSWLTVDHSSGDANAGSAGGAGTGSNDGSTSSQPAPGGRVDDPTARAVPTSSGHGKRIVFDQSDQRVWLIGRKGALARTYLVSGSIHDNLSPGTYHVYSRSPHAVSFDGRETMRFMVRFTQGVNAAIGFHDIPRRPDGSLAETRRQLGTPRSAGCIRQWRPDAKALWRFAPVGTKVVVVA